MATFLGGSGTDGAVAVRVDASGNIYIAGTTSSANFPVTPNAVQKTGPGTGCRDVRNHSIECVSLFVAKFAPDGALLYSTYLGESSVERLIAMELDSSGAVYLLASMSAQDPAILDLKPLNGYPATYSGYAVVKLRPDGTSVAYARTLPVPRGVPQALAVDPAGSVYLTGQATGDLPLVNGSQASRQQPAFFKTTDAGRTWAVGGSIDLAAGSVSVVAVDPRNPETVYIGFDQTLYRSTDGGAHWTALLTGGPPDAPTPAPQLRPLSLVFDPFNAGTMYLLRASGGGIYKTTDNGATWKAVGAGVSVPRSIAIDPSNPSVLYAAGDGGLYKSTDAGATWSVLLANPAQYSCGCFVAGVAIDPKTPTTIYLATREGVMKSVDAGATWTLKTTGFVEQFNVLNLAVDPVDPRILVATTVLNSTGFAPYRSTDGGEHWTRSQWPDPGYRYVKQFLFDPLVHTTVWAATSVGLMVSRDSGATWTESPTSLPQTDILGLAASSTAALYAIVNGSSFPDAFAMKLDPTGSNLLYSTYVGGSGTDTGTAIAVDAQGRAYIAGATDSFDLPGASGLQSRPAGGRDAFVSALEPAGRMLWSTYLGGTGDDSASAIALDGSGDIHVAGQTASTDFPLRSPSQTALNGSSDAFAAKIKSGGSALLFSTYIGGSNIDYARAVASDTSGNTYVAGGTRSVDFLATMPLQQPSSAVTTSTFAAAWNDGTGALLWSTVMGRDATDQLAHALAVDASGAAYIAGGTNSDFPARRYAAQDAFGGALDAFLAKIALDSTAQPVPALNAAVDAASYSPSVAPGEIVALFGSYFVTTPAQAGGYPLPPELGDLSASVNGVSAPLYYVSPFQVNAQIPYETAAGTATIRITTPAGSATTQAQVAAAAPAIFTQDASGSGPGAIEHGIGLALVTDANPAVAGETVAIYCTGLGAVDPPSATGAAARLPLSYTRATVEATMGGKAAKVTFSGLTPGLAGLYQVNAEVPSGLAAGRQPVELSLGGVRSNVVTLAIRE